MYVYLLKHVGKPTFKIGKAIDIHVRIPLIGGHAVFDLASSLCVEFPTEADSKRHERVLHRLFHEWNVRPVDGERHEGDTEHFEIECFNRVVKFLNDNQDLTLGRIVPIPPRPANLRDGDMRDLLSPEARRARREERQRRRQEEDEASNLVSIDNWTAFLDWFSQDSNRVLKVTSESPGGEIEIALSVDDPDTFRNNLSTRKGWCDFSYTGQHEQGCFGYGVISQRGSIRTPTLVGLTIKAADMSIVEQYASPELAKKIMAINAWIESKLHRTQRGQQGGCFDLIADQEPDPGHRTSSASD